jgi:hypothetical protein
MVEFLEGGILRRYLLEKYSKNPAGWSFTVFPSKHQDNGLGALIGTRDEIWRIQLDSIYNANPIMLGAKADVDPDMIPRSKNLSYGYRRLDRKAIRAILRDFQKQDGLSDVQAPSLHGDYEEHGSPWARNNGSLDRILASLEPVYPRGNEAYAEGPIVLSSRKGIEPIVDKQTDLEEKLSKELKRLLKRKYSAYG